MVSGIEEAAKRGRYSNFASTLKEIEKIIKKLTKKREKI